MQRIYSLKDKVDTGYDVSGGKTYVSFEEGGSEFPVVGSKILAGVVEYLADQTKQGRLYSVSMDEFAEKTPVAFKDLNNRLVKYEEGYEANIGLAQILEAADTYYLSKLKELPKEMLEYKKAAMLFFSLVQSLRLENRKLKKRELTHMVDKAMVQPIYEDGMLWGFESRKSKVDFTPTPLKDYVEGFDPGAVICKSGEPGDTMYIILQGTIGVRRDGVFLGSLDKKGEVVGELSLFLDHPRYATLVAEDKVILVAIKKDRVKEFHKTHPELFLHIARSLSSRIAHTLERERRFGVALKDAADSRGAFFAERNKAFFELYQTLGVARNTIRSNVVNRVWGDLSDVLARSQ